MLKKVSALIAWFLPSDLPRDPQVYRHTRFIVAVCLAVFVVEPAFSLWHLFVTENLGAAIGTFAIGCVGLIVTLLVRAGLHVKNAVHILTATIYFGMFGICLSRHGFIVTAVLPNILFPLVWVLLEQRGAALFWAGAGFVELSTLAVLSHAGMFELRPETALDYPQMAGYLGASTIVAMLYDSTRRSVEKERANLRARVESAQRLETVGHLAAGVAHDFNNLLTVVRTANDVIAETLPKRDPLRQETDAIEEAVARAGTITKQLLGFARPVRDAATVFDANALVGGLKDLLARLSNKVTLEVKLLAEPCHVCANSEAIAHAILNLVTNARDATPDGGTIVVEVGRETIGADDPLPSGSYVTLAVTDRGAGIPDAVLPHVFDPFFTTKTKASGTGLGLSSGLGAARAAGGDLRVTTEVGKGSRFVLLLPETTGVIDPPVPSPAPVAVTATLPSSQVTVLVVDDQEALLRTTRRLLAQHGFRVVEANSGQAALDLLAHEGQIDVLLTDVQMPGMSGHVLSKRFRELRPNVPVVYMSGYSEEPEVTEEVSSNRARFVRKPFDRAQLVGELEAALGSRVRSGA